MDSILRNGSELNLSIEEKNLIISKLKIENLKNENVPTQTHTIESITGESFQNECIYIPYPQEKTEKKKLFKIKKIQKFKKLLSEICSEEDISELEKNTKDPMIKKISPFSKVNFSKLRDEEKNDRLKNLAKLVKRLRRRVRNLEHKVKVNPSKLLNKYLWSKLGINTKNKYLKPEFEFDFEKIIKALKKIRNYEEFEYNDEKHVIENIINLVANGDLKLDSLIYKKISSLLRMALPQDKVKYISKNSCKVTISFPETEVFISNKEYLNLAKLKENEDALRAALGIENPNNRNIKIFKEEPKEQINNSQINSRSNLDINNSNLLWMLGENQYKNMLMNSLTFSLNNNINSGMQYVNNFNIGGFVNQFNSSNFMNNNENKNNNMFLK